MPEVARRDQAVAEGVGRLGVRNAMNSAELRVVHEA